MSSRIAVIQGHPDRAGNHFGHALAAAYTEGARSAGHTVDVISVAELDFPLLRDKEDWEKGETPAVLKPAQEVITAADHIVIFYPLWMGTMPSILKGFLEQVLRPGCALSVRPDGRWVKNFKGKSARIVVTMGMPALLYRWYFGAHSLKSLERNILKLIGVRPVHATIIGLVEGLSENKSKKWLQKLQSLGSKAA